MQVYLDLLWSFLQVGLFSIGGGYAALPLIEAQVVEKHAWLSGAEFRDIITISQITPGPIAINTASFVGTRIAGIPGALTASFAVVLPSFIIVLILAKLYYKYRSLSLVQDTLKTLRPAVVALIAKAGLNLFSDAVLLGSQVLSLANINWLGLVLIIISFLILYKKKANTLVVIGLSGLANLIIYLLKTKLN